MGIKIKDDFVNLRYYYYHTSPSLDAYSHFVSGNWRTQKGYYGKGVYGFAYPPSRSDSYGSFVFRFHCLRPYSIFFADVDLGKQFITGYSAGIGVGVLKNHFVPDKYINGVHGKLGLKDVLEGKDINDSVLFVGDGSKVCFLNDYEFDGMAYKSHDGYALVFWNFSPNLLRITGVKSVGDSAFKDIPVGASQQDVEDIFYGRVSKRTASGSVKDIDGFPVSKYASASLIKYIRSNAPGHIFDYLKKEVYGWLFGGMVRLKDACILESWYVRCNLTNRRSVYGSSFAGSDLSLMVVVSRLMAYSCTDSKATLLDYSDVVDFKRLRRYIYPFSLENHHPLIVWKDAISYVGFKDDDPVVYVPDLRFTGSFGSKEDVAVSCLADLVFFPELSVWAKKFVDYCTSLDIDVVTLYNSKKTVTLFSTKDSFDVKPIKEVTSTGIVFE